MAGARIRPAGPADAEPVAGLAAALAAHQGEPAMLTAAAFRQDGCGPAAKFRTFVAEIEGRVVGYAVVESIYDTSHAAIGLILADLFVGEAERRRGLGRCLVQAVARLAVAEGCAFVWWSSKPWNREAHAFYASLGASAEPVMAHLLTGPALQAVAGPDPRAGPAPD